MTFLCWWKGRNRTGEVGSSFSELKVSSIHKAFRQVEYEMEQIIPSAAQCNDLHQNEPSISFVLKIIVWHLSGGARVLRLFTLFVNELCRIRSTSEWYWIRSSWIFFWRQSNYVAVERVAKCSWASYQRPHRVLRSNGCEEIMRARRRPKSNQSQVSSEIWVDSFWWWFSIKFSFEKNRRPLILGIETSCDDTGCALIDGNRVVHGDTVHSQLGIHLR